MKKAIVFALVLPCLLALVSCQKEINRDAQREVSLQKSGNATIWNQTIQLSGLNENPPNELGATGVAILRVTADLVLHSKVNVDAPPEAGDLTAAHIHFGTAEQNGGVFILLVGNESQFGENRTTQLTEDQFNTLLTASLYVNAHSTVKPGGLVRGQIR